VNEHGDVTQLWGQSGTCKASYEYDAFGNEWKPEKGDGNPFRYCGEYLDLETNTYYLRARSYRPVLGRFLSEDSHWNPGNMIYGNNPSKINERSVPNVVAIMASSNLYAYCLNNPLAYHDPLGLAPTAIYDFLGNYAGEYNWTAKGDKYTVTINDKTLKYNGSGKNKHGMNIWVEDGKAMAEDYDLAYFFRVSGWVEYFPEFEWMDGHPNPNDDYLFRVKVHPYFLNFPFNLDFAKEVTAMKSTDSLYTGLTEKGITAETFAHGLFYYGTEDIKQLHPEIASINSSSGFIDVAATDHRIGTFETIWNVMRYTKSYVFNYEVFKY